MVYAILITINLTSIINAGFIIFLWSKLYYDTPLLKYEIPEAFPSSPSAPELK